MQTSIVKPFAELYDLKCGEAAYMLKTNDAVLTKHLCTAAFLQLANTHTADLLKIKKPPSALTVATYTISGCSILRHLEEAQQRTTQDADCIIKLIPDSDVRVYAVVRSDFDFRKFFSSFIAALEKDYKDYESHGCKGLPNLEYIEL